MAVFPSRISARLSFGAILVVLCLLSLAVRRTGYRMPDIRPERVELLFAGDLMQHMPQVESARRDTAFDYRPVFEALLPRFRSADLVFVNLETTLTRSGRYTGYPCFRSPAVLADAMSEAGIDVAVMANNHCCDGGAVGVRTTVAELDRCGIARTGVFVDSADRATHHPLYLACRGIRFAVVDYTYGTNGIPVPRGIGVNRIDTADMARDLAAARAAGVDCIIACMHWGDEYARRENALQRTLAAFLHRHGADLVIGSHPHVIQPVEADSAGVTVYSLGNFVSNQRKRYCDGGLLVKIEATKHPDGRMRYRMEPIPVWVSLPDYRILPPEAADTMPVSAAWRRFLDDASGTLDSVL